MLNKTYINTLMEEIREKGRYLDYCLIANLFQCEQILLVDELKKYQNNDGGFGKALEPDVRLPNSNIVSTLEAISIIAEIDNSLFKENITKQIVEYLENSYNIETNSWELVPKEVNQYPRAIWWNYEDNSDFDYGNPNPEIIGFLYKNKKFVSKINLDLEVERVLDYIKNVFLEKANKHNILSCLHFYNYMPLDIKERIYTILEEAITKEFNNYNWEKYSLEPYEVKLVAPMFLVNHEDILKKNLEHNQDKLDKGLIMPNWTWGQFEDVFKKIKYEWAGHLTFKVIKALLT